MNLILMTLIHWLTVSGSVQFQSCKVKSCKFSVTRRGEYLGCDSGGPAATTVATVNAAYPPAASRSDTKTTVAKIETKLIE
jgi:hypothetical protein